jgi:hypothetical protein
VCHDHKVKWCIGENLFSTWRHLSEEEHLRNAEMLAGYREAGPLVTQAMKEARKSPPPLTVEEQEFDRMLGMLSDTDFWNFVCSRPQ